MSKLSKIAKTQRDIERKKPVVNFMGGISYVLNPLDTLKMISASSIFAEPQYYRDGQYKDAYIKNYLNEYVEDYAVFDIEGDKTTSEIMISAINDALSYDFEATIKWAQTLRYDYYMRLNPQVIMVLAALHPNRIEYSKKHPGLFRSINKSVMRRADEPSAQLAFYLYYKGSKNNIPSILKRSWCDRIEDMNRYEVAKYKNAELGLIDTVRICHASSPIINELMKTGKVEVEEEDKTWEVLRSSGKTFKEIMSIINIPHMALLRNLRNIFKELTNVDRDLAVSILDTLVKGVPGGKQFPFRYYTALKQISNNKALPFQPLLIDALEKCIDASIENMPKLKGKTICLSDNSGSAWGTFNSEYGYVTVADIDNLSSVITAANSDEGYVGKFGDRLKIYPISKRDGVLSQTSKISDDKIDDVGGSTENGIWLFFEDAINNNVFYDNIFIYSDMQAGHAGLYGTGSAYVIDGENFGSSHRYQRYIDVMKLIAKYRAKVNPKVNVFCVQTAGYNNVLIPEYIYRGAVLYGWTGKEALFASEIIRQWDEIERRESNALISE